MPTQGGLTLYLRTPNDLIYNYALSSAYKSAWVYDPSFALSRDPDIWEIVRNDAVIKGCMNRCVRAVVRPWRVMPARHSRRKEDRILADICWEGLSYIDEFDARRRRLADAIFVARTYAAITWRRMKLSLADTTEMDWWVPVELRDIDRRRVHWVADWKPAQGGGQTKTMSMKMFDTEKWSWETVSPQQRLHMVEWTYENTEDRVGMGRGLLEPIYFYHWMKTVTFEKISQGIDRWANGIWKVKLDSLRGASSGKTNENLVRTAKSMLRNMRTEHVAVLGDGDEIEVIETTGAGHQAAMEFLHYLDDEIERLVNGSIRASGGGTGSETGARAQAETEADTAESYHQDDRDGLDSVINRDLVGAFLRENRDNLDKLGLGDAKRPRFTSEQVERQDPVIAMQVAESMQRIGAPLVRAEVYEKANYSLPGPDDDILLAQQPGVTGMGMQPRRPEGVGGMGGQFAPKLKEGDAGGDGEGNGGEEGGAADGNGNGGRKEKPEFSAPPPIHVNVSPPAVTVNLSSPPPSAAQMSAHERLVGGLGRVLSKKKKGKTDGR